MAENYPLKEPMVIKTIGEGGEVKVAQTITSLDIDWPEDGVLRGKHLVATDGYEGYLARSLALLGLLSGHPYRVMLELADVDIMVLVERLEGFRKPGRPTGATS
ncbi:MAG: hypothetical protein GC145_14360 [Caulobacter sp.]|nr:hypothetical protein [Caulobacter sp.]